MPISTYELIIEDVIKSLDVPDSAYEAAQRRYTDLGKWLEDSSKAISASFSPHVYAQGSFRLGTVTRPWKREDYDLDLACKLQEGATKSTYTQAQLKHLVGLDLEKYRRERGIQEKSEEKHRCWRIKYQDELKFHMDIVPAIPEEEIQKQALQEGMIRAGTPDTLAKDVTKHAVSITDDRHPQYNTLTYEWPISNQEGYAVWFESRMRQAQQFLESRAAIEKVAKVDALPAYRWKTPLQRCVQILKRHRDMMFDRDADGKPISAIITTLAARSYQGETDVASALNTILIGLGRFVNPFTPRVPNPVNAKEDFADKWPTDPRLESNFWMWLQQIQEDFGILRQSNDVNLLTETALQKFGANIDPFKLSMANDLLDKASAINSGAAHTSPLGSIGALGVENPPHEFYG